MAGRLNAASGDVGRGPRPRRGAAALGGLTAAVQAAHPWLLGGACVTTAGRGGGSAGRGEVVLVALRCGAGRGCTCG